MEIDEKSAKAQTQFAGKKYYFCSEDCQKKFEGSPEEYVDATAAEISAATLQEENAPFAGALFFS